MGNRKNAEMIQSLFDQNEMEDIQNLLKSRRRLNRMNIYMIYLFHIIQCAGIFVTAVATAYKVQNIIFVGVGLNSIASLIHIIEKSNAKLSMQMLQDIQRIKSGTYVDEGVIIDPNIDGKDDQQNATNNPYDTSAPPSAATYTPQNAENGPEAPTSIITTVEKAGLKFISQKAGSIFPDSV